MAFTTTITTSTSSSTRTTLTSLFVSASIDPKKNKDNKFFFASKMEEKQDTTPALPQEYFRDRIAFARQRALMASLAKNRKDANTSTSTTTLNAISKKEKQQPIANAQQNNDKNKEATFAPPNTMDLVESLQAKQSYFKQRIQMARQRALMANIATAKQAQMRTTDTLLQKTTKTTTTTTTTTTSSSTKSAAIPTTATTTTHSISSRTVEARQRALLAAQLAYHSPILQAQRQRQAYFAKRIQASRQRALLASIAGAVANKQSLTTDTLKSSSIAAQRSKRAEAVQRALLTAQLQQRNNSSNNTVNSNNNNDAPTKQQQAAATFQISSRTIKMDRQALLLQEIQTQMSQTTKQRIMGNKAARKAARMANRQARKEQAQAQRPQSN